MKAAVLLSADELRALKTWCPTCYVIGGSLCFTSKARRVGKRKIMGQIVRFRPHKTRIVYAKKNPEEVIP